MAARSPQGHYNNSLNIPRKSCTVVVEHSYFTKEDDKGDYRQLKSIVPCRKGRTIDKNRQVNIKPSVFKGVHLII